MQKRILIAIGVLILTMAAGVALWLYEPEKETKRTVEAPEMEVLAYFIEQLTGIPGDYKARGMTGGVSAADLMSQYPTLLPTDFDDAQAYRGRYSVNDEGQLTFTVAEGEGGSALTRAGLATLSMNLAARFDTDLSSEADIDYILSRLTEPSVEDATP